MSSGKPRRIIRGWKGIEAFSGYGRTQTQKLIDEGLWPQPVKLGERAVGWFADEVAQAQERLIERNKKAGQ